MLALTHFSTRYPVRVLRDEARAVFPNTVLPRDFDTIEIPFPERGEPELIRWEDRRAEEQASADTASDRRGWRTDVSRRSRAAERADRLTCPRTRERLETDRMVLERVRAEHAEELFELLRRPARRPHAVRLRRAAERRRDGRQPRRTSSSTGSATGSGCGCCATGRPAPSSGAAVCSTRSSPAATRSRSAGRSRPRAGARVLRPRWPTQQFAVAFDDLGLGEIVAFTLPTNIASRRVMEKSGFAYEREIVHAGLPHVLYRQAAPHIRRTRC